MRLLHELCSIPTAPFVEGRVVTYVERFVRARRGLRLSRDEHGNLLIELGGRGTRQPRWIFAAHMDHPGMVARRMIDRKTVEADFRGGVLSKYVQGTKVRFFDGDREIPGRVVAVDSEKDAPRAKLVRVRVNAEVAPGVLGMFDVAEARLRGKRFSSRVIDNLAGAAATLTMIDQLHRRPPEAPVAVLLTRAEEDGFIGAIAAARQPKLVRKTDRLIVIECSAMQPYAPQGMGPIIRVGDKTSIFNSSLSYFLTQQAEELKKRNKNFQYQRALMPGGTCEATVYDVYGFQAASICIALGNYHNMDRQKKRIAPEYIDINDWQQMVKLFVAIARKGHEYKPGHAALKARLEKRVKTLRHLL